MAATATATGGATAVSTAVLTAAAAPPAGTEDPAMETAAAEEEEASSLTVTRYACTGGIESRTPFPVISSFILLDSRGVGMGAKAGKKILALSNADVSCCVH